MEQLIEKRLESRGETWKKSSTAQCKAQALEQETKEQRKNKEASNKPPISCVFPHSNYMEFIHNSWSFCGLYCVLILGANFSSE